MKRILFLTAILVLGTIVGCGKSGNKEVHLKMGKPTEIWIFKPGTKEHSTKFIITFKNVFIVKRGNSKEVKITFTAKNLGPRPGYPHLDFCELKLDNGNIYEMRGSSVQLKMLEPGEVTDYFFLFEIPKDRTPVGLTGLIVSGFGDLESLRSTSRRFRISLDTATGDKTKER